MRSNGFHLFYVQNAALVHSAIAPPSGQGCLIRLSGVMKNHEKKTHFTEIDQIYWTKTLPTLLWPLQG